MDSTIEIIMILLVLSDMALLGLSRLRACISIVSFQGMLFGLLVLVTHFSSITPRLIMIAAASFIIKGFVFLILLRRAIREAGTQHESEPFVGYIMSIISGMIMLGVSLWLGERLPLFAAMQRYFSYYSGRADDFIYRPVSYHCAPETRLISAWAISLWKMEFIPLALFSVVEIPLLVELGILLDVFVAVFVMGIAIYHINREFDHLDSDRLNILKG